MIGFVAHLVPVVIGWLGLLLLLLLVNLLRARSPLARILAVDILAVVLAALLGAVALERRSAHFLDVAGFIALLSFVETLAAARFWGRRSERGGGGAGGGGAG